MRVLFAAVIGLLFITVAALTAPYGVLAEGIGLFVVCAIGMTGYRRIQKHDGL